MEELTTGTATPASVSLPPTFQNSFWSADYRTGFESLYKRLETGLIESSELIHFIQSRASAERNFAKALIPRKLDEAGFGFDEGASLKMGFEQLLYSSVQENKVRTALGQELITTIINPFSQWSIEHQGRIQSSETVVKNHLTSYERKLSEVSKLKISYDSLCVAADTFQDEITFTKGTSDEREITTNSTKEQPLEPVESLEPVKDEIVDDNDGMISRSGATGGSITAALSRALSSRRPSTSILAKDLPTAPQALDWSKNTFNSLFERVAGPQTNEAKNEKARSDAETAEERYKEGVEALDQLRVTLEEALYEHYNYTCRCENDRLKAAASVMKSFQAAITKSTKSLIISNEKVAASLQLVRPEKDVLALIERSRTSSGFQPRPTIFHSHYSEPAFKTFGLDLRKWEETNQTPELKVPAILPFLLDYITESYAKISVIERRKAWLYETPLAAQHHLRSALNNPNHLDRTILERYDLPVVVSTLKLWLLELDVPVILYSQYEEYRTLYPKRVGAEVVEVPANAIAAYVSRLPSTHLETLRALIAHFVALIKDIETEETEKESVDVYLQKLSIAFARCIIRPKQDTPLTLDDRFPALLFIDLVKSFEQVFSDADLLRTKQREDRYKPRRQRTKVVDVRVSRSSLGTDENSQVNISKGEQLLKQQRNNVVTSAPLPDLPPQPIDSTTSTSPLPASPPSTSQPSSPSTTPVVTSTISPSSSIGSLSSKPRVTRGPRPLPGTTSDTVVPLASSIPFEERSEEVKVAEITE